MHEIAKILSDHEQAAFVLIRPARGLGRFIKASLGMDAPGAKSSPVGYIESWYVDPDLRQQGF